MAHEIFQWLPLIFNDFSRQNAIFPGQHKIQWLFQSRVKFHDFSRPVGTLIYYVLAEGAHLLCPCWRYPSIMSLLMVHLQLWVPLITTKFTYFDSIYRGLSPIHMKYDIIDLVHTRIMTVPFILHWPTDKMSYVVQKQHNEGRWIQLSLSLSTKSHQTSPYDCHCLHVVVRL